MKIPEGVNLWIVEACVIVAAIVLCAAECAAKFIEGAQE